MTEMIERATVAMTFVPIDRDARWSELTDDERGLLARAVIESMRQATEAMVASGRKSMRDAGLLPAYTDESPDGREPIMAYMIEKCAWPAMIDVALGDEAIRKGEA